MEPRQVIEAMFEELTNSSPADVAAKYMSEDMRMEQDGFPVRDRDGWVASQSMFEFDSADGDIMRGTSRARGTHTGDIDLSALGLGVIAATGKVVESRNELEYTVRDDRVVRMVARPGDDGGLKGVLAQLGVEMPGG